jgi:hypothetical protein
MIASEQKDYGPVIAPWVAAWLELVSRQGT